MSEPSVAVLLLYTAVVFFCGHYAGTRWRKMDEIAERIMDKPLDILDTRIHGWTVRELLELSFIAGYKEACDAEPTTILIDDYMEDFRRALFTREADIDD